MTVLSSFEVLAETLVPPGIVPPASNPLLIQGYFVQISLSPEGPVGQVSFSLIFNETTDFTQGAGQKALQAQVIDATGKVNFYPNASFFGSGTRGFLGQSISAGQTLIYGVQVLMPSSMAELAAPVPQGGTGWRGTVRVQSSYKGALIATPTQRLVYFRGANAAAPLLDATVYAVPTATGSTTI